MRHVLWLGVLLVLVSCSSADLLEVPGGPDAGRESGGTPPDGGSRDASEVDSRVDGGPTADAPSLETGAGDATIADAPTIDAGPDATTIDTGLADAGDASGIDGGVLGCVGGWCWVNPLPQGNSLVAAWGAASNDVWAVGDATL